MGYSTDFTGAFKITPALTAEHASELKRLAALEDRDDLPDWAPDAYLKWVPTEDGSEYEWDGGEKFYEYTDWLVALIENFFRPNGYALSGEVDYQGEDPDDRGTIFIEDDNVSQVRDQIVKARRK